MSLLFNILSRLVITFLTRSKCLLISWLQSPSAVILEPQKIKSATVSSSICHEMMGPDAMIFIFWMLSFKPTFLLSSFTFIKRLLAVIQVVLMCLLQMGIYFESVWYKRIWDDSYFKDNFGKIHFIFSHTIIIKHVGWKLGYTKWHHKEMRYTELISNTVDEYIFF